MSAQTTTVTNIDKHDRQKTKNARTEPYRLEVKDCVKGMIEMADASVDLVVTSPPYNLGIKYKNYNDSRNRSEFLNWSREWPVTLNVS